MTLLSDTLSRFAVYRLPKEGALLRGILWVCMSFLGGYLIVGPKIPYLVWPAMFLVFWANGSIYAETNKYIDRKIGHEYNLSALSLWLFLGDIGSVAGSQSWEAARSWVCHGVNSQHMCL